ncbi:hypothetical protein D3C86_1524230 [compost metagenome]
MQTQADKQRRQPRQRPTDRRTLGEEKQRCQQVQKGQTEAGQHWQPFTLPLRSLSRQCAAQLIEAEQQRPAEHQRPQRRPAQQAARAHAQFTEERQRRTQLQQQGKGPGQRSLLTQAEPENPRTFHCPGGSRPAGVEPQRNRQGGEDHTQRQTGLRQQQGPPPVQPSGEPHVDHAQHQRTERRGEIQVPH